MRLAAAALFAAACSGTPDTGDAPAFVEPLDFMVTAAFGYDPALDATAPYRFHPADYGLHPWIELTVRIRLPDGTQDACTMAVNHDELTGPLGRATWAGGDIPFGIELADDSSAGGNCRDWNPDDWGANPAFAVAAHTWGVGVAPLEDGVESTLRARFPDEDWDLHWDPHVVGGRLVTSALPEPVSTAYTFGYEVDDTFTFLPAPMDSGMMDTGMDSAPSALHSPLMGVTIMSREQLTGIDTLPRGVFVVATSEAIPVGVLAPQ